MIDGVPVIGFRVDVTLRIGAGHAMRCLSIARALVARGVKVIFFVSCDESAVFFRGEGFDCRVIAADERNLTKVDAERLGSSLRECGASCILIDSYGVDGGFFVAVEEGALGGMGVVYIDDLYTSALGIIGEPMRRPVDAVVNFNVFADEERYRSTYRGTATRLMLGPRYAPLREEFAKRRKAPFGGSVTDVLVTSGSTNPSCILERLSGLCLAGTDDARIHVVVGPKADFLEVSSKRVIVHRGESMVDLMALCQMAVAAAGVTLLELAAMGIPTLAVGVVDNQYQDIGAYEGMGLGLGCYAADDDASITSKIVRLFNDGDLRIDFARRCADAVDGRGAERIASAVLDISKGAK